MLTTVLSQLMDRVGEDGNVTPGLFNDQAAQFLGQGSFDHANKENRRRNFLASDSALAVEFRDEFERAKAINLELQSRIVLSAGEVLPVSIFDGPIEGFSADNEKLHKRIMEERDEFRSRDLSQRAASPTHHLPPPDGLLREHERPVFEVSLQQLARPQYPLYEHTMEYNNGAAFWYSDSSTEDSCRQAHSFGLA
jgi:hypothetical protein